MSGVVSVGCRVGRLVDAHDSRRSDGSVLRSCVGFGFDAWRNMSENPQTHRHKNGACVRGSVRPDGDRMLSYLRKLRGFAFASPSSS